MKTKNPLQFRQLNVRSTQHRPTTKK